MNLFIYSYKDKERDRGCN